MKVYDKERALAWEKARRLRDRAARMDIANAQHPLIEVPPVRNFTPSEIMELLPTIQELNNKVGMIPKHLFA